jgi:hypothetical protein
MVPPVWFDRERGRVPTRQCWRCVSERPIVGLRTDDFRRLGWPLPHTHTMPSWCGHSTEYDPWPIGPLWDSGAPPTPWIGSQYRSRPGQTASEVASRPMTMPDLGRPDVTPALPSLDWSAWSNLAGIWRGATIPNVPGLYRVRRIGAATIDYIGQTGAGGITLRRDVTMLRASIGPMLRRPLGGASFPHHRSATIKSRHATVHETVRCRLRNCLQYGRYTAFQSGSRCRDDTRPQV